jgi:hypothetical protein
VQHIIIISRVQRSSSPKSYQEKKKKKWLSNAPMSIDSHTPSRARCAKKRSSGCPQVFNNHFLLHHHINIFASPNRAPTPPAPVPPPIRLPNPPPPPPLPPLLALNLSNSWNCPPLPAPLIPLIPPNSPGGSLIPNWLSIFVKTPPVISGMMTRKKVLTGLRRARE